MSWAGVAIAGATVVSGYMSSQAAGDAADAQVAAGDRANELQRRMFEEGRADQQPWRDRGNQAGNMLQYYLGLDPNGASGGSAGVGANNYGVGAPPSIEQFTARPMTPIHTYGPLEGGDQRGGKQYGYTTQNAPGAPVIDQAGYHAALAAYNTKLQAAKDAAQAQAQAASADPRFGSLIKPFTGESVATDPGYQFGLQQGQQTITNSRAALSSLLSGATLKDLTQFGNDYGGTKFNEAFSRDSATKQQINNMLAGVSGTGMTTANNMATNANNVGAQIGQNIMGQGNARASGYIGQANAMNSTVGSLANQYQSANLLKSVMGNGGSSPYNYGGGVGNSEGISLSRVYDS